MKIIREESDREKNRKQKEKSKVSLINKTKIFDEMRIKSFERKIVYHQKKKMIDSINPIQSKWPTPFNLSPKHEVYSLRTRSKITEFQHNSNSPLNPKPKAMQPVTYNFLHQELPPYGKLSKPIYWLYSNIFSFHYSPGGQHILK